MNDNLFGWVDYLVFSLMLLCSALIGVYFAFFAKQKQNTTSEYLMGGKKMGIFPISMSLIASYISGITLLGIPAEIYVYGTIYWLTSISQFFVCASMSTIYLPVFYKLQITSSYEYLNLRFNRPVRLLGSLFFLVKMLLYIPIVVYVPALAFNQVTGINIHLVTPIVCFVCIFYTTLGGLKAVVWTDTLQTILMFGGVIIVMVLGTLKVGGVSEVYKQSWETNRLELFVMDLDPTIRHTFWGLLFGSYFNSLSSYTVNQAMVQRCLAMPTLRKAITTIIILVFGVLFIVSMSCFTGLIVFAYFHDCDPISTQIIKKADQILPYFVMEISEVVPGLPGLFVAGVFSAALSTMSTGLNSMTGIIFEDLIRPAVKNPISESHASTIMKIMAAILGFTCVALVFLVEKMGALVQTVSSLLGVVSGPLLGMFTLGMCFPWANSKGAFSGGVTSFLFVSWMSFGSQYHVSRGLISYAKKPVSIDGCPSDLINATILHSSEPPDNNNVFILYRVSYLYYVMIGTIVTILVGLVVSFITGPRDVREINRDLLSPVIHRFLPRKPEPTHKEVVKLNQRDIKNEID